MLKSLISAVKNIKEKYRHNKLVSVTGQLAVFVLLFMAISAYLAKDMLASQQVVANLSYQQLAPLNSQNAMPKDWSSAPLHLVYFFAPWCQVCALSQPSLNAFHSLRPEVEISLIALGWETAQEVQAYQDKHQFDLPIFLAPQSTQAQWQVDAYPSYYFINDKGEVISKDRGLVTLPGLLARSL